MGTQFSKSIYEFASKEQAKQIAEQVVEYNVRDNYVRVIPYDIVDLDEFIASKGQVIPTVREFDDESIPYVLDIKIGDGKTKMSELDIVFSSEIIHDKYNLIMNEHNATVSHFKKINIIQSISIIFLAIVQLLYILL